jgi:hypothetical protein
LTDPAGYGKLKVVKEEAVKMLFAVYTDLEGYIGDVSAPSRKAAVEFLAAQGYQPGAYELRELAE